MSGKKPVLDHSTQMTLILGAFFIVGSFFIGTVSGINWGEEISQLISPRAYQLAPNQNYCVQVGKERYLRKPGESRMAPPCLIHVANGEGIRRFVSISFWKDFQQEELRAKLPATKDMYSLWRRKIYNGEVEQTRLFTGSADAFVTKHIFQDTTDNPGYMAYFILPSENGQECGDNIDLSICTKVLLGEVLWW